MSEVKNHVIELISKEELILEIRKAVIEASNLKNEEIPFEKLLSQSQACEYLGIAKSTIIRWGTLGKVRPIPVGGKVLYKLSELVNIGE